MMKNFVFFVTTILALHVHSSVVINHVGGSCGGRGDRAPTDMKTDNCWDGIRCNNTNNLICMRFSKDEWTCVPRGSPGHDGKAVYADQCVSPDRVAIYKDGEKEPDELVVPLWGACGGTGAQTPKDRHPVMGCWDNTRCAGNAICVQRAERGELYQCLTPGSSDYGTKGDKVYKDACDYFEYGPLL